MLMHGFPKTECLCKLANRMKEIIECGLKFDSKHLIEIIQSIDINTMNMQEVM